jgi:hypothetical protein
LIYIEKIEAESAVRNAVEQVRV